MSPTVLIFLITLGITLIIFLLILLAMYGYNKCCGAVHRPDEQMHTLAII